jgi:UDP-3-O-[3-hydroxymyristoyl] glucosamine N-acyltransferase
MHITLAEIAQWMNGRVEGDASIEITGLAKIEEAKPGHLTFIANPKYAKFIRTTMASAVLVGMDFPSFDKTLLRVQDPYFCFLNLVKKFYSSRPTVPEGIHPTVVMGDNVQVGKHVAFAPYVVIGRGCRIGDGVVLYPGVVLDDEVSVGDNTIIYANVSVRERCLIGKNVIIHMGAVIGSDGFGFAFEDGRYHKIPQVGIVHIEDDVEIGANTTIDRATLGETLIRTGVKLDNLIQIAHNVVVKEHTVIAAQTGISGSTTIGAYVKMGGQVGLAGHIEVGDHATVGAQAGVTKSVPPDVFVTGYPAKEIMKIRREEAALTRLPELLKKVRRLEAEIEQLKNSLQKNELKEEGSC